MLGLILPWGETLPRWFSRPGRLRRPEKRGSPIDMSSRPQATAAVLIFCPGVDVTRGSGGELNEKNPPPARILTGGVPMFDVKA